MTEFSALEAEHARLTQWRNENADKTGTLEYRKSTISHRLLTDLLERDGGTEADRAEVARQLAQVEDGTHPQLSEFRE